MSHQFRMNCQRRGSTTNSQVFAGGPSTMGECCKMGDTLSNRECHRIAMVGKLRAKYILHAVGPIHGPHKDQASLLASAY